MTRIARGETLQGMTEQSTPIAASSDPAKIDDLFKLILPDGLKVDRGGAKIAYRVARLCETNVADERKAEALAERAVMVNGAYKLLISESTFKHALNMLHIESLHCDGEVIHKAHIDLALYDKLSTRDMEVIEQRIFLITMAAEVRYGNITQQHFEEVMAGLDSKPLFRSPQPVGQAAGLGADADQPQSGPALLADFTGNRADGAAEANGAAAHEAA